MGKFRYRPPAEETIPEKRRICFTSGKEMYANQAAAETAAKRLVKTKNAPQLRSYRCMYCDAWHLTSKEK